jgi:membrane peptidoglycan carboxypeptidase
LVALDAETGDVLAHVSSDPARPDAFDRVRSARRQPGSAVKPLLLLEAFQDCGRQQPLHPATRVADAPMTISLPSGDWSPSNPDDQYHGTVEIRDALEQSLNVPFVRVADHCGFQQMADRMRSAGMRLPSDLPPSFVLGSIETTPLELARAFTAFAIPGATVRPRPVLRLTKPGGGGLHRYRLNRDRVTGAASAYLVEDLLQRTAESGTAQGARIEGMPVAAKTGTSSGGRDAWLAGHAGSVVAVVWVGRDDDRPMGLSGGASAAPIWQDFMVVAARARPARTTPRPGGIIEAYVDPKTGLRVRSSKAGARECLFRKGVMPRKNRPVLRDAPEGVIE